MLSQAREIYSSLSQVQILPWTVMHLILLLLTIILHMGGFAQFGLNLFKRGQKRFNQLQLSLDTDKLKSCNFVCSSITARLGFAKVICRDCDHCKCPKMHLKH